MAEMADFLTPAELAAEGILHTRSLTERICKLNKQTVNLAAWLRSAASNQTPPCMYQDDQRFADTPS